MRDVHSDVKKHVLLTAAEQIARRGSASLHMAELARSADVAKATVYYNFRTRRRLIAEAQAYNFGQLTYKMKDCISEAEQSVEDRDNDSFWNAVGDCMILSWEVGHSEDRWSIVGVLMDIESEDVTLDVYAAHFGERIDRWSSVIARAKRLGWINANVDVDAFVVALWSASIGQVAFAHSTKFDLSPERFKDFFIAFARS